MKVKQSWLHTVTMRCNLVITIKWWRNALEHDDLSALNWPHVFLKKIMWLQTTLYFINQNFLPHFVLWVLKNYFSAQLCLLRAFWLPTSPHASSCLCRHFAGKQPAECKGHNTLLILAKNHQLIHLIKYRIFGAEKAKLMTNKISGINKVISYKDHITNNKVYSSTCFVYCF